MHLSRLTLSLQDISSYSMLLLVLYSSLCLDDLITDALFSFI